MTDPVDPRVEVAAKALHDSHHNLFMSWHDQATALLAKTDAMQADAVVAEREQCAKIAERHLSQVAINEPLWHDGQDWAAESIALAIRARPDAAGDGVAHAARVVLAEIERRGLWLAGETPILRASDLRALAGEPT